MSINDFISFAGNGYDQSSILVTFAILDTVLGISRHLVMSLPLISNKFLSGVIRNFIPGFLPALLEALESTHPGSPVSYPYAEFIIFIGAGYFLLQSILANLNGLGTPLPKWLSKLITNELKGKGLK